MFDFLITGGIVVDGSGAPRRRADVGIRGGVVEAVGDLSSAPAARVLPAEGAIVSPGFVDIHTHSELPLLADGRGMSKILQGVTTEVVGNCGFTPYPIRPERRNLLIQMLGRHTGSGTRFDWTDMAGFLDRLERQGVSVNVVPLVGHGSLRVAAMGFENRPPTADEQQEMRCLTAEAMEQGAFGLSTGLTLAPGLFAEPAEILDLARVAAGSGGLYFTHMRVWARQQLEARLEAIEVGRQARIPVQMAHNNVLGRPYWSLVDGVLSAIEDANREGVDVTYDVYPYIAAGTGFVQMMPEWVQQGGIQVMNERLRDPATRQRIKEELAPGWFRGGVPWEWDSFQLTYLSQPEDKRFEGKTIAQAAEELGLDPMEAALTLLERSSAEVVIFHMAEENVRRLLRHPLGMVGSDGSAVATEGPTRHGKPHPRFFGATARVLGKYVREEGVLSLEEAVHKMSGSPAKRLGLKRRGLLQEGQAADVVVFDPERVVDRATFQDPQQYAEGVRHVLVNGQFVVEDGRHTGARPGQVLRRGSA